MLIAGWQFFIDVGGTFTDVVAQRPDGSLTTYKLLSSGRIRGQGAIGADCIVDPARIGEPENLWVGYRVSLLTGERNAETQKRRNAEMDDQYRDRKGAGLDGARVIVFDSHIGALRLDHAVVPPTARPISYELYCDEEAPVVAIRVLMGLRLDEPIGPVDVRLGTTRATNALLERKGARVAFVTTKGFADILKIGNQDRPALFELNIRKREELAAHVVEVDARMDARGEVLHAPDESTVRRQLEEARKKGAEAVAVCLLHAYVNPAHEEQIARIAESVGFTDVSVSSRLSRLERMVPRGDTTVADAYLGGVIRSYVASLRRCLPEARIRLMTSAGGLSDAALVAAKDTILSGPAGGVVGCAFVTREAGFDRAIGFDMGGTSTDVCRIEAPPAPFEYQHETVKAGVRLMAPMLAVETVAAGGGSICAFDGQKLTVGPHSAGADPGPACYGRGGPLTITDMNLFLGRLDAMLFPFNLDREVVESKMAELCGEVKAKTGSQLSPAELAEGFIRIANANMSAAIKRISIAKGYDVGDYVLTTFGGAGAQHACAVARSLGIRRVLCNPHAGVLSAVGIGVSPVKRIAERSVHEAATPMGWQTLAAIFTEISAGLRQAMLAEGVGEDELTFSRMADACYAGQSALLTVPAEDVEQVRAAFEAAHQRLYGYRHENREIEIRVARVEASGQSGRLPASTGGAARDNGRGVAEHRMCVDGRFRGVPACHRDDLRAGERIVGPAIVFERGATIVVDPGWEARVLQTGDLLLTDARVDRPAHLAPLPGGEGDESWARERAEVDPVRLELFHNQFAAIAEQMGVTLRRTALSVNVKERLDFSCAVFTPEGELVANAPHIPVHLGGMSDCVKCLMEDVPAFQPGDVYVTNDPYRGGSHLNDVTVVAPVHDEAGGRLLFFVASRAHHAEIGGKSPGSMPPDSTNLAEEGVLIRSFRYLDRGHPRINELRALLTCGPYPSRTPDENLADIAAQVAANQTGVRELVSMIDRHGLHVVHGFMRHIQSAAERKMRAALRKVADGVYRFEDRLDDGSTIRLAITVNQGEAVLDFMGTDPVHLGNLNANRAIVTSAVLYCLRCLIDEDIPLNAGVLAPVKIILPPCLLNPPPAEDPRKCPAIVGGNVETSQRIVDCIFGALGTVAASQGTMNNLLMGNKRFGYYETICGGAGAGPGFHGADAVHTHMTNTRLTDPEVLEARYPVRLVRFEIRRGSGGAGHFHGGDGAVREIEFLEPLEVSILSQRRTTVPYGLRGGEPGRPGRNILRREGSISDEVLPSITSVSVRAGDRLIIETPGGGGWGKA